LQRLDEKATEQQLRDFIGGFGFSGEQALSQVGPMSGGEKARLVLALIVYLRPNMLLLDEPTNHLDSTMREALVFALQDYQGAMVIVSHDRHLLRTTVDEFYLVANQQVQPFAGDLDDYHDWLKQHVAQPQTTANTSASNTPSRKDEKREAAQRRQALKPLKDALQKAEKIMAQHEQALAAVTAQLGDNDLYSAERKAELTQLLSQQAQLQQHLEQAELAWMDAAEALQQAEAE